MSDYFKQAVLSAVLTALTLCLALWFIVGCETIDKAVSDQIAPKPTPAETVPPPATPTATATSVITSTSTSTSTSTGTSTVVITSTSTSTSAETKPVDPESEYPLVGWGSRYDSTIRKVVTDNMISQPASRMSKFCPKWATMSSEQRVQFYADLFYGIAKPESSYRTLAMYMEPKQGIDYYTGLRTVSEGLLQLSYKDKRGYPKCEFTHEKDLPALKDDFIGYTSGSKLSKHPERSILNPYKNLRCGVYITDKLLGRDDLKSMEFADMMGRYWSTMRAVNNHLDEIKAKMVYRKSACY